MIQNNINFEANVETCNAKDFATCFSDYSVPSTTVESIRLDFQATLQMSKFQTFIEKNALAASALAVTNGTVIITGDKVKVIQNNENNIKIDLREIGWYGLDWIDLAQDRDQWRALVNTVMNLRVP
jgi:hypothetical protein